MSVSVTVQPYVSQPVSAYTTHQSINLDVNGAAGTVPVSLGVGSSTQFQAVPVPGGAVSTTPDSVNRNVITPSGDTFKGIEIDSHSSSQSAALFRIKNGSDTLFGIAGAFGGGTSILDSTTFFIASPPTSTAVLFGEFIANSGLDNLWLENTGIGPTRSSVACFSNDNGDAALRAFSNGAGQTAPIFQVGHTGHSVMDIGPDKIGVFNTAAVVKQTGASAADIAAIADAPAKAAITALQAALAAYGWVTSPA